MSLSGNMELKEMLERKVQWKTIDGTISHKKLDYSDDYDNVSLEP
jgi:hypothetical protein